jgi:Ca2+-binding RTX toxin-like protein
LGTDANERFDFDQDGWPVPVLVEAEGGNDYVAGSEYKDTIYGGLGNDVLLGFAEADTIHGDHGPKGNGGDDQILSGTGADAVFGGGGHDYVNAGDGDDLVDGGDGDDYVVGGFGADAIYGSAGNDILLGNGIPQGGALPLLEIITVDVNGPDGSAITPEQYGGSLGELPLVDDDAVDVIYGGIGDDLLFGFGGSDQLNGGLGSDQLVGGLGKDDLEGGRGADFFAYAEFGAGNYDHIEGFQKSDTILLDVDVFTGIGSASETLKKKYFHEGTEAEGTNDKIIFDKSSGIIYYDQDGSGDAHAMEEVASIHHGFKLKADYFDLV